MLLFWLWHWLDARGTFSLSDGSEFGKNVMILGADVSSSVHIGTKKKNILLLVKCPTDRLDDITLTVEK